MSRAAEQEAYIIDPEGTARRAAETGNTSITNALLWACEELSIPEKYGILAHAYERRIELEQERAGRSEAGEIHQVPPWQLEKIGLSAIARHLREQAALQRSQKKPNLK